MSLDPVAVPIVMKAVDFLFGEAKKILDERRAARKAAKQPEVAPSAPPDIPLLEQDKNTVIRRRVSEELVRAKEQTIQSLLDQIAIYVRNRQQLEKRAALEGGRDYAPINVVRQLETQEDAILERSQQLAAIVDDLSKA